jgi:hypothetical protein
MMLSPSEAKVWLGYLTINALIASRRFAIGGLVMRSRVSIARTQPSGSNPARTEA